MRLILLTDLNPSPKALYLREYRAKKKLAQEEENKKLAKLQALDERNWNKAKEAENKEDNLGREVLVDEDTFQDSCRDNQTLNDFINDKPKIIDTNSQYENDGDSFMHSSFWRDDSNDNKLNRISHQTNLKRLFGNSDRCED